MIKLLDLYGNTTGHCDDLSSFKAVSIQSTAVLEVLERDHIYFADIYLAREKRDYSEDIHQLGGNVPVWVFDMTEIGDKEDPTCWIMPLQQQMSASRDLLSRSLLFDLEIPYDCVKRGITHNADRRALVLPELRLEWVRAVYYLECPGNRLGTYSFIPVTIYSDNCLFRDAVTLNTERADELCFRDNHYTLKVSKNLECSIVDVRKNNCFLSSSITLFKVTDYWHVQVDANSPEEATGRTVRLLKHFFKTGAESY